MTEHRDAPETGPAFDQGLPGKSRRGFSRLIESPAARRVAIPKILAASTLLLVVLLMIGWSTSRLIVAWVAARQAYQLPFSEIELVPPPDPWVKGETSGILEQVRENSRYGPTINFLDLDLKRIEADFRTCAWVKDVLLVEKSYRRLTIHLTYRKPVAVVVILPKQHEAGKLPPIAYPIDDEAVYLPDTDIDWVSKNPFQVRGMSEPLIEIREVLSTIPPKVGTPWKLPASDNPLDGGDPMVFRAAKLADFLQGRAQANRDFPGRPSFASIHIPDVPDHPFILMDRDNHRVDWGKAPGDEKWGEPSCDARWKMLLDWIKVHGPLTAKWPDYLSFDRTSAQLSRSTRVEKR